MSEFQLADRGDGHFAVSGDLSFETANKVLRASEAVFRRHSSLDIDLSGVDKADSAGLALLIEWKAQAAQRKATIRFTGLPESLLGIARVSEVDDLL